MTLTKLLNQTLANRYHVDKLIGRGGGAAVFLATHTEMDRVVAIKVLNPQKTTESTEKRFTQEARIISQFNHPNTITVFDYGQHEGHLFLVMEYIEGGSLEDYVLEHHKLSAKIAVEIAIGILGSLEEAHHYGVLHRDLKPENIMLTQNFKGELMPKVVDFGIAKVLSAENAVSAGLTQENAFVGTPRYTAPEQILSDDISPASDLYNVGLIMWFMLVGKPPVDSRKVKECLRAHLSKKPWVLPDTAHVPKTLAAIVHKALLKDPRQRYEQSHEMADDLRAWLKQPTAQNTATLQKTNLVIKELMESVNEEKEDGWMFDQSHIIDPNVMHTSELLGVTASSFDLTSIFSDEEIPLGLSEPSAASMAKKRQALDQLTSPYKKTNSSEFSATELSSDLVQTPRRAPQSPHIRKAEALPPAKSPINLTVLASVTVVAIIGIGAYFWHAYQSGLKENKKVEPQTKVIPVKTEPVAKKLEPLKVPPVHENKYTLDGLLMVVKSQGWRMSRADEESNLSSYRQRLYLFYKKDAKLEVSIITPKNSNVGKELLSRVRSPAKALSFEHNIVKLEPQNAKATRAIPELVKTFERYRDIVENHKSNHTKKPTPKPTP